MAQAWHQQIDVDPSDPYDEGYNHAKHECYEGLTVLLRTHSADIAVALRDAERYRWLKCNCQHMPDEIGIAGQLYFGTYAWGDLDTAIDSAMQQGGGGGE